MSEQKGGRDGCEEVEVDGAGHQLSRELQSGSRPTLPQGWEGGGRVYGQKGRQHGRWRGEEARKKWENSV